MQLSATMALQLNDDDDDEIYWSSPNKGLFRINYINTNLVTLQW